MANLKSTLKHFDLYGYVIIFKLLKKHFNFVSYCCDLIPTAGSYTRSSKGVVPTESENGYTIKIKRFIFHRNGRVTMQTNRGYLQFFN